MNPQIEQKLLRRLKILGVVLFVFAVVALIYDKIPMEDDLETPPLNPFMVSSVFGIVGSSCLFISWKKNRRKNTLDE